MELYHAYGINWPCNLRHVQIYIVEIWFPYPSHSLDIYPKFKHMVNSYTLLKSIIHSFSNDLIEPTLDKE